MSTGTQQQDNRMINIHDIRYNGKSGIIPKFEDRNYVATVDVKKHYGIVPEDDIANVMVWRDADGKQTPVLIQGNDIICYENSWTTKNCFRRIG
jgi:hypothetical protein